MAKVNIKQTGHGKYRFVFTKDLEDVIKTPLMEVFSLQILSGDNEILKDGSIFMEFQLTDDFEIECMDKAISSMRQNIMKLKDINWS